MFNGLRYSTSFSRRMVACVLAALLPVISSGVCLAKPTAGTAASTAVTGNWVHITADQQDYDPDTGRYNLTGDVVVTYRDYKITSSEADMILDASGDPRLANFYHRPVANKILAAAAGKPVRKDEVIGDTLTLYLAQDVFGAEGNVHSRITTVAENPFIIRSDTQQFDNRNNLVTATGNVQVQYEGTDATSDKAYLRIREGGQAEKAVFIGGATLKKENSKINGGKITVMVESGNLHAEDGVETRVKDGTDTIIIRSDYQHYDKSSDKMLASGHVKVTYGNYIATGPKATFKLNKGELDNILMTGRPTIVEDDRTIIADKIVITTNPKNFDATGNVKIQFKTQGGLGAPDGGTNDGGKQPAPSAGSGAVVEGPEAPPPDDVLDY